MPYNNTVHKCRIVFSIFIHRDHNDIAVKNNSKTNQQSGNHKIYIDTSKQSIQHNLYHSPIEDSGQTFMDIHHITTTIRGSDCPEIWFMVCRSVLSEELMRSARGNSKDAIRHRLEDMDAQMSAMDTMADNMEADFKHTRLVSTHT